MNQGKLWYQTQVVEIFYDNVTYLSILDWKNAFYYCKEHWPLMQLWQIEKPEITTCDYIAIKDGYFMRVEKFCKMMHWKYFGRKSGNSHCSNFSCMFLNPNNFSNLNSNCSNLWDMRNLQEQFYKAICYQ